MFIIVSRAIVRNSSIFMSHGMVGFCPEGTNWPQRSLFVTVIACWAARGEGGAGKMRSHQTVCHMFLISSSIFAHTRGRRLPLSQ